VIGGSEGIIALQYCEMLRKSGVTGWLRSAVHAIWGLVQFHYQQEIQAKTLFHLSLQLQLQVWR
jgi:hypothetical protein